MMGWGRTDDLGVERFPLALVVAVSFGAAALAVALEAPAVVRGPLVLWAVLGAPAPVVASRLRARPGAERWVVGVAAAASVAMIASLVVLYAGVWSAPLVLGLLAVVWLVVAGGRRLAG